MGLSNFPSAADGVLPVLVMNTVLSVALLKNMFRSILQVIGATSSSSSSSSSSYSANPNMEADSGDEIINSSSRSRSKRRRRRRISITQYKSVGGRGWGMVECCVCLCGFQGSEEVSELSCKHFFHKACLDKWFLHRHSTCPLCRSID